MAINFEDQKFKDLGIEGAVRIAGRPEVFTIGTGGGGIIEGQAAPGAETPESFQQKFGTLEQEGIVQEISPEEAAELGIDVSFMTPQNETLDVGDIDEEVPTDVLEEGADQFDISRIMSERQAEYERLTKLQEPTEEEIRLGEERIEKSSEIEQARIQAKADIAGLEGQGRGITTGLIRGEQAKLAEQAELQIQTLQSQERTLLSRLGLEQEKRKGLIETAKTMLGFTSEDIDTSFKIQDRIDKENKDFLDRVEKMSDDAQAQIDEIMKNYEGIDFEDLSEQEIANIAGLASQAGVDVETIARGLKVQKDNFLFERQRKIQADTLDIMREQRISANEAERIAISRANLAVSQARLTGEVEDLTGLPKEIDDAATEFLNLRAGLGAEPSSEQYWNIARIYAKRTGYDIEDVDRLMINRIMEKEGRLPTTPQPVETENLGSDFVTEQEEVDYVPFIFRGEEVIAKRKEDLPKDARLIYDKLKEDNPYSSAALLIRESLKAVGLK